MHCSSKLLEDNESPNQCETHSNSVKFHIEPTRIKTLLVFYLVELTQTSHKWKRFEYYLPKKKEKKVLLGFRSNLL